MLCSYCIKIVFHFWIESAVEELKRSKIVP